MTPIEPAPIIAEPIERTELRETDAGTEVWQRVQILAKGAVAAERVLLDQASQMDIALVEIVGQYWTRARERTTKFGDEIAARQAEIT